MNDEAKELTNTSAGQDSATTNNVKASNIEACNVSASNVLAEDNSASPEPESLVNIEDFAKIKFKVGTILEVTEIPKSKKLLKFTVDAGEENHRSILAGIKKFYHDPQVLVGEQIVFVANLKPAKLAGEVSQGMCLAGSDAEDTTLCLIGPKMSLPNGAEVR